MWGRKITLFCLHILIPSSICFARDISSLSRAQTEVKYGTILKKDKKMVFTSSLEETDLFGMKLYSAFSELRDSKRAERQQSRKGSK